MSESNDETGDQLVELQDDISGEGTNSCNEDHYQKMSSEYCLQCPSYLGWLYEFSQCELCVTVVYEEGRENH